MLGDFAERVAEQRQLLRSCGVETFEPRDDGQVALDLGCGSGIQSVALAELGYGAVLAVDASRTLLDELTARSTGMLAIRPIQADLCAGLNGIAWPRSITTAVCMGDTLPHLPGSAGVRRLVEDTAAALKPGGVFVLSFRNLTARLSGSDRFIPVRAERDRIMTCFLEDEGDAVRVHDLIHTRRPDESWRLSTSSYRKLRLAPAWVAQLLTESGFVEVSVTPGPPGMCVITGRRGAER
jgi:SAM-dependent methyltransferase